MQGLFTLLTQLTTRAGQTGPNLDGYERSAVEIAVILRAIDNAGLFCWDDVCNGNVTSSLVCMASPSVAFSCGNCSHNACANHTVGCDWCTALAAPSAPPVAMHPRSPLLPPAAPPVAEDGALLIVIAICCVFLALTIVVSAWCDRRRRQVQQRAAPVARAVADHHAVGSRDSKARSTELSRPEALGYAASAA